MNGKTGVEIFNLGTGTGTSVLEVVAAFSKACGKELPYVIRERRAGDIAANWCDASKAERMMGWKAQYDMRTCAATAGIGRAITPTASPTLSSKKPTYRSCPDLTM